MNSNLKHYQRIIWLCIFSVAMAFVESSVVIYLRNLYYPDGFDFPLSAGSKEILFVELGREFSTIIMLVSVAVLTGKSIIQRIAIFGFCFGIWDIFYYIWLKLLVNWPSSIFEMDILFLIPVPWVGPVIAPIIVSLSLIVAALLILWLEKINVPFIFSRNKWFLGILAGLFIITSFVWEYKAVLQQSIPEKYPWGIFLIGEALGLLVFFKAFLSSLSFKPQEL